MNRIFRAAFPALEAAMLLIFSSCGEEDGKEPGNSNGNAYKVNPKIAFPNGLLKTIDGIPLLYNDNGQLISMTFDNDEYTFEYEGDAVSMTIINDGNGVKSVFAFEVGDNGLARKGAVQYGDEEFPYLLEFTYDDDGHLIASSSTVNADTYTDKDLQKYVYVDGDIVSEVSTNGGGVEYTTTFNYGSEIENKGGIMLYQDVFGLEPDYLSGAYFAGLLGKPSKHLPERSVRERNVNDYNDYVLKFDWIVNDKGFAHSLSVTNPSSSHWLVGTFGW